MRVMVTGATGFVGRHVVSRLLQNGHTVTAVARDSTRAEALPWYDDVQFVSCDLHKNSQILFQKGGVPDALVHLAWPGLPNYQEFFHIGSNLSADIAFLHAAVEANVAQVVVAGTCLEYGMQYGPLAEDQETAPHTSYGFAKDSLRKGLQFLQRQRPFCLQWMRLFYMHGEGQSSNSLIAQLDRAIEQGDAVFNMSAGNQLRDYLAVDAVADNFVLALENPDRCHGVINCCSGIPVSVLDLVRQRCEAKSSDIRLNRGYHPYPSYEPMAFWGIPAKLDNLRRKEAV